MARQIVRRGVRRKTQWLGMADSSGAAVLNDPASVGAGASAIISQGVIVAAGSVVTLITVPSLRTHG